MRRMAILQRTQIIWHVAELSQHSGIAEIPGRRITSATERAAAGVGGRLKLARSIIWQSCLLRCCPKINNLKYLIFGTKISTFREMLGYLHFHLV
jgi:hypothetical protein